MNAICDKRQDCRDSSDEELCGNYGEKEYEDSRGTTFPPAVIHIDGRGDYDIEPLASFSHCPQTHFLCQGKSKCLTSVSPLPITHCEFCCCCSENDNLL